MNNFYNEELANAIRGQMEFEQLVMRVEVYPAILSTLSLCELEKIERYYEEMIQQKEKQILRLTYSVSDD